MGSKPVNISGSRAAKILNLSDFGSPFMGYLDIMESIEPGYCEASGYPYEPFEGNAATEMGNAFEDAIAHTAGVLEGRIIIDRERPFVHPKYDFITCHVDGILLPLTDAGLLCHDLYEAKTTTEFNFRDKWGEPGTNRIPRDYQAQIQHNLMVCGLDRAIVYVLVFPKRQDELCNLAEFDFNRTLQWARVLNEMGFLHRYEVEANKSLQATMLELEVEFWERHIVKRTPPEPRDWPDIRALCPAPKGTIIAPKEVESFAKEYKAITKEIGQANKRKTQLKTLIVDFMRKTANAPIDSDSVEKWILRDSTGKKIGSFDGKKYL